MILAACGAFVLAARSTIEWYAMGFALAFVLVRDALALIPKL